MTLFYRHIYERQRCKRPLKEASNLSVGHCDTLAQDVFFRADGNLQFPKKIFLIAGADAIKRSLHRGEIEISAKGFE